MRSFNPTGTYTGHWGVDLGAAPETSVTAADDGRVTFAGEVAGMLTVTVAHGGGLRTSYSYLSSIVVEVGDRVTRSTVLGHSGLDHGRAALHLSVRLGDEYLDPAEWLVCFEAPQRGLRLFPVPGAYALGRATRHPRRYLRSASPGTPLCR